MNPSYHPNDDHYNMKLLYEASYEGCVERLISLITHKDRLILHKISQTSFPQTPLHISSLLGHLDFTKALLSHNPHLALELDSSRSTPLHLASAEGHIQIVKELLKGKANKEACLFPNEEGRIPLHYAAMRGRVEIAKELIRAKAESLSLHDNNGNNVLHFCVMYNHLETLKALVVELEPQKSGEILNHTTFDGKNTILHLAVMFKQVETVRYLLSISEIREAGSIMKNAMGFTAHDMVKQSPEDLKSLKIQAILTKAGGIITTPQEMIGLESPQAHPPPPHQCTSTSTDLIDEIRPRNKDNNCCERIFNFTGNWFNHPDKDTWFKEMKKNLSLVATLISTLSFQALINPPGGFIQQGSASSNPTPQTLSPLGQPNNYFSPQPPLGDSLECFRLNGHKFCPGEALLSFHYRVLFFLYLCCNTTSFVSSLSVALLLVSGFSLKNRVVMWVISLGMCVALMSLALAYFFAALMIVPFELWDQTYCVLFGSLAAWIVLVAIVASLFTIRFSVWVVKSCVRGVEWMRKENFVLDLKVKAKGYK
ncbi:ankyrin repeat-containing protein [Senna tora]|uniref:Ankyrin repeat-containing protein n=1 Tax=Senna tora TaxID=362788 RepID=A0A835CKL1_9FABA|nr:ankyrin repeat-containing protein [Senna tora]